MGNSKTTSFGQWMLKTRLGLHIMAKDLAEKTGISPTVISRYENGRRSPNWVNAQKIMDALGATTEVSDAKA